jgi:hypothetical protein
MATRSRIGIEKVDGSVVSIYCQWDGYPENNGRLLSEHYTDVEKVEELIGLGDISYLAERVKPEGDNHTYNTPEEGTVVAYHRDRGEEFRKPRVDHSVEGYWRSDLEDYGYLFTHEGVWMIKGFSSEGPIPVEDALNELKQNS